MLDLKSLLLKTLEKGSNSLVAIAVGTAEGTRAPDGAFTGAWWGRMDPFNGNMNQGSFSFQGTAVNPREADFLQLEKIKKILLPAFLNAFQDYALPPERFIELWVLACDCFTQSEAVCLDERGFLDLIKTIGDGNVSDLINCRINAYYDPKTGKLDAPKFNNNLRQLEQNQKNRTQAVLRALIKQNQPIAV